MDKPEKRILLVLGTALLVLLAIVLAKHDGAQKTAAGEFVAPSFDAAAMSGKPENVNQAIYGTLVLNNEVTVSLYSSPIVSGDTAQVYFAAEAQNAAWVRLRLLDSKGNLLGESGLLRPGEYVESIILTTQPKHPEAVAKILTYEPNTYYSLGTATAQLLLQFADE